MASYKMILMLKLNHTSQISNFCHLFFNAVFDIVFFFCVHIIFEFTSSTASNYCQTKRFYALKFEFLIIGNC